MTKRRLWAQQRPHRGTRTARDSGKLGIWATDFVPPDKWRQERR